MKSWCLLGQRSRLLHYSISLCKEDMKYLHIKKKIKICWTNRTINKNRLRTLRNSIKIISRCGFREVSQNMNRGEDKAVNSKNLKQYLNTDQRGMWGQHTGLRAWECVSHWPLGLQTTHLLQQVIIWWEAAALCDTWCLVVFPPCAFPIVCLHSQHRNIDWLWYIQKKKVFKNEYLCKVKCFLIGGI